MVEYQERLETCPTKDVYGGWIDEVSTYFGQSYSQVKVICSACMPNKL